MEQAELRALASDSVFHPVDGGAVVYHVEARRIFALNATAALVWLNLRHGKSDAAIEDDLAHTLAIGAEQATAWFRECIASFSAVLQDVASPAEMPEPLPPPGDAPGTEYQFLERGVRISMPEAVRPAVDSLLRGLGRSQRSHIDLALAVEPQGSDLQLTSSSGASVVRPPEEIVAEIEAEIVRHVVPRVPHMLAFHAALLARGDRAVLFPGQSGVGKTTLSTLLATRGWRYATDEMALLSRSGEWQGQPFPPCVKEANYQRITRWLPDLADVPEIRRFGRLVKFAPVDVQPLAGAVRTVVFPQYGAQSSMQIAPIAPMEGLARLLGHCVFVPMGFEQDDVTRLLHWHERARYFSLTFSDAESAATMLEAAIDGLESTSIQC